MGGYTFIAMRTLALDYGSSCCGCAVSDPGGSLARPLAPISEPRSESGMKAIATLVSQLAVERVVVGLPIGLGGQEGPQARETKEFVAHLRGQIPAPVEMFDERFTTQLARRTIVDARGLGSPVRAKEDSVAAAHLLSSYLDAKLRRVTD